ncbi:MAG TPA: hypothetical protein VF847_03820, partial [Candidatus Deferrimicrobiaceae bacterium]
MKGFRFAPLALLVLVPAWLLSTATAPAAAPAAKPAGGAGENTCYDCHELIKELKTSGKHAGVGCDKCHAGIAEHLADSDKKPVTKV